MADKRKQSLGARLRAARLSAELSQTQLSDLCGIPKPTLSRYENDHVLPSLTTLTRIAKALNIPITDLVANTDPGENLLLEALRRRGIRVRSVAEAEHFMDLIEDDPGSSSRRRRRRA